jgi:hypothetical protein
MAFAASNRVGLYWKAESVWGEAVTGAFTQLRYTGESLDRDKQTARSETIREDRMTDELAVLGYSVQGDINFEMAALAWDNLIAQALCSTWASDVIENGVLTPSFQIEKKFADISKFMWLNGCRISDWELDITAMQIIKSKFGVLGKAADYTATTSTSSTSAAAVSKLMTASANVGSIELNGSALTTGIKSIKIQFINDLRKQEVVGSQAVGGIGYGGFQVKGSVEAYFEDLTLADQVVDHTNVSLGFILSDADGNSFEFLLPKLYWTKGAPKAGAQNQDVMIPLEFEGVRDETENSMVKITRVVAP